MKAKCDRGKREGVCRSHQYRAVPSDKRGDVVKEVLSLWRRSVAATHFFLTEEDVISLLPIVETAWMTLPDAWIVQDERGKLLAFMGWAEEHLEMVFVDPDKRGQGLGKKLVSLALHVGGVRYVNVNEQNPAALGFYRRMGFVVTGRSAIDGQDRPFPLLHMCWKPEEADVPQETAATAGTGNGDSVKQ